MNNLNLTCALNNNTLLPNAGQRLLYLLLEVQPGSSPDVKQPLPVNLGLVVDVSESMYIRLASSSDLAELAQMGYLEEIITDGVPAWRVKDLPREALSRFPRKIDRVKEALLSMVGLLQPEDTFSLVTFAGHAMILIANTSGQDKRRLAAEIEKLGELELGDDTYIGRGMELSLAEMQRAGRQRVGRMLLLTDGFTRDEADCRRYAELSRAAGISISTMGLGGEFNEELLIPMADQSGGNAYFVDDINEMSAIFARELSAVQAIACRNLELKLHFMQGVELRRAFRVKPVISELGHLTKLGDSYSLPLGDLEQDAPPALLLEVIAPARQAGTYRLGQVVLAYDPADMGDSGQKIRQDVVVNYVAGAGPEAPNPRVMNLVETVSAFKLQTRALQEAEAGDIGSATRKLQAAATRLLDMGEDALAAAMQEQARQLSQQGQLDAGATKKLRYETRKLTQKLS